MHFKARHVRFYFIGFVVIAQSVASFVMNDQEQVSQFIRRLYHGSFILGKTLYIDGGEENHWVDGTIEYSMPIDLSSSFSTSLNNNGVQIQKIDKGICPNFNFIRFWTDVAANTVYAYGGQFSSLNPWVGSTTVPLESLWSFTPNSDGGTWQSMDQSSPVFNSITRPSEGSVASGDIGGFNLGGYADSYSSQKIEGHGTIPVPGLQFYNFTSQQWFNTSATGYTPDGTAIWSGTVYVPTWGPAGLLVAFGGQKSTGTSAVVDGAAYLPMSDISLFDPSTQAWYHQQTMGDAPTQRDRFCVVGINGGNNSTYEIFLYGGQVGNGAWDGYSASQKINEGLDQVYILSLPSFVWFKANYTSSDPRIYHTCNIAGNRQMLSIGGVNPSTANWSAAVHQTDTFWEGIKVFDLTTLEWTDYFNATAPPYLTPRAISDYYAAGSRYPSTWSSSELENLFVKSASKPSTPIGPSASASKSSTPIRPSASVLSQPGTQYTTKRKPAMIGGAVGGVAAGILMSLALYLLARKRANAKGHKREKNKLPPPSTDGEPNPMGRTPEAGQVLAYEADSRQALPHEVDSGQNLPHEADSRPLHELSNQSKVE